MPKIKYKLGLTNIGPCCGLPTIPVGSQTDGRSALLAYCSGFVNRRQTNHKHKEMACFCTKMVPMGLWSPMIGYNIPQSI